MITFYEFDNEQFQSDALAKAVGDALNMSLGAQAGTPLDEASRAMLAVSGGTSPRLFLQTLSTQ